MTPPPFWIPAHRRSFLGCLACLLFFPSLANSQEVEATRSHTARLHLIDAGNSQGLQKLFRWTGERLPIVSAHRGGARPSFPENCLATFEDTLRHTYAMIEIDPRYTNDHQIVLHHDVSLERTTSGHGRVADHTLQELKSLRLKDSEGELTEFTIPTLDEALVWARGKAILVLDQKDVTLQDRIKKIEEHHAEGYAILIVSNYEQVRECHKRNPEIMMEVMIPTREKLQRFSSLGVPFGNVVAFVGHDPPADEELLKNLHAKQVCCIAGTSRNLDRQWPQARETAGPALQAGYRSLPAMGVDLIETDIPTKLGRLLYADGQVPAAKAEYFHRP